MSISALDISGVIFDFDYTLADSSPGIIECANFALRRLGLPEASDHAIRHTIGMSLERTFAVLGEGRQPERASEFTRLFIQRADVVMHDATEMYGFVPQLVNALRQRHIRIGIVSSKYRRRIEAILRRDGLYEHIAVIVGGEDVETLKPDPTGLMRAVSALGGDATRCLYVGDSVVDAETAQRASVPFAAALSGVTPRKAFCRYAPLGYLDSAAQLPRALGIDAHIVD